MKTKTAHQTTNKKQRRKPHAKKTQQPKTEHKSFKFLSCIFSFLGRTSLGNTVDQKKQFCNMY